MKHYFFIHLCLLNFCKRTGQALCIWLLQLWSSRKQRHKCANMILCYRKCFSEWKFSLFWPFDTEILTSSCDCGRNFIHSVFWFSHIFTVRGPLFLSVLPDRKSQIWRVFVGFRSPHFSTKNLEVSWTPSAASGKSPTHHRIDQEPL